MCGLPPFVDELIDVFIDDDMVVVGVPRLFTRPLRLTAPEGFALVAAGRAAMQLPGADPRGPLGRGLDKLAAALGDDGVIVDLPRVEPDRRADRAAASTRPGGSSACGSRYWTPSRDEVTEREITPRRVFSDRGEWYVVADDQRSGERRTFRIDRIESRRAPPGRSTTPTRPPPRRLGGAADVVRRRRLPRVTLRLRPAAAWVVERYPVDDVRELADGDLEVADGDGQRAVARAAAAAARPGRPRWSTPPISPTSGAAPPPGSWSATPHAPEAIGRDTPMTAWGPKGA